MGIFSRIFGKKEEANILDERAVELGDFSKLNQEMTGILEALRLSEISKFYYELQKNQDISFLGLGKKAEEAEQVINLHLANLNSLATEIKSQRLLDYIDNNLTADLNKIKKKLEELKKESPRGRLNTTKILEHFKEIIAKKEEIKGGWEEVKKGI